MHLLALHVLLALILVPRHCSVYGASSVPVVVATVARSTTSAADITVDSSDNVVYVSYSNHAVYRLAASGVSQLIAGSGINSGHGTTDGPGQAAKFYEPIGITCDVATNIAFPIIATTVSEG
jgi:hypothetical protein